MFRASREQLGAEFGYGVGLVKILVGPSSTIRPAFITAMRSHKIATQSHGYKT